MYKKLILIFQIPAFLFLGGLLIIFLCCTKNLCALVVSGVVYEDINKNNVFDENDKGIPKIGVSNGIDIVLTDKKGRYQIDLKGSDHVFIIKPDKYECFLDKTTKIPQFFSFFDVNTLKKEKINNVNFALTRGEKKKDFSVVFLGDIQVRNEEQLAYFRDVFMPDLIEEKADLYITLGDNVYDNMLLYPALLKTLGKLETNIYYTAGNHDITTIANGPDLQYLTYNKYIGPTYFSFNYGNVHFVILESVKWDGYSYYGEFGKRQLNWLKNNLKYVDRDKLVFFIMHIPIVRWNGLNQFLDSVNDKDDFLNIVKDYKNSLIIAGHSHTIEKIYNEDYLKHNGKPLEIPILIAGAVSGEKWRGEADEYGIPYARMKDGSPKGYYFMAIKDNKFKETYKIPGRPNDDQMDIYFVDNNTLISNSSVLYNKSDNLSLVVNVFNGDMYSQVLYSLNDRNYVSMDREFLIDPLFYNLSNPAKPYRSFHIWSTDLIELEKGINKIKVKYIDKDDKVFEKIKLLEIK